MILKPFFLKEILHVLDTDVSWPDFKWCRFYCELSSPTWTNGESAGRKLEQWTIPLTEEPILNSQKTKGLFDKPFATLPLFLFTSHKIKHILTFLHFLYKINHI
jgi:hypothetical protein